MVNYPFSITKTQSRYIKKLQVIQNLAFRSMGIKTRIPSHLSKIELPSSYNIDFFENSQIEKKWKTINSLAKQIMTEHEQRVFKLITFDQFDTFAGKIPQCVFENVMDHIKKIIKILKKMA